MYEDIRSTFIYFKDVEIEEYDLYYIAYAQVPISHEDRKALKDAGWRLTRHTRTNQEIWVFDKKEEIGRYEQSLAATAVTERA